MTKLEQFFSDINTKKVPYRETTSDYKGKFNKREYMKVYKERKKKEKKIFNKHRKQECSLKVSPQCLDFFITNLNETVCVRCKTQNTPKE